MNQAGNTMFHYTLAFLVRNDEVLLLNRHKSPWMGAWNGVGGKIQPNETPKQCIKREIAEETGIHIAIDDIIDKGSLTWNIFDAKGNGLYLFVVHLSKDLIYQTPKVVDEGILDWKKISWASDMDNQGIARNIPHFLPVILNDPHHYEFKCTFEGDHLVEVEKALL